MRVPIKQYIWAVFMQNPASTSNLPSHYVTREEIEFHAMRVITESLDAGGYQDHEANRDLASRFFDGLLESESIDAISDDLAGAFYRVDQSKAEFFRNAELEASDANLKSNAVGAKRFFRSAFDRYYGDMWNELDLDQSGHLVPASDRIVTLNDNQKSSLDVAVTNLIEIIEKENAIDGDVKLTDRIIGQIRAARELIRAATFNAFILHQTIMTLLGGLIIKYKDQAIGETATALYALLIQQIFTGN